jgi:hypothetical protein
VNDKFKIGDSVVIKPGIIDEETGQDIGGWQGRVIEFHTYEDKRTLGLSLE